LIGGAVAVLEFGAAVEDDMGGELDIVGYDTLADRVERRFPGDAAAARPADDSDAGFVDAGSAASTLSANLSTVASA